MESLKEEIKILLSRAYISAREHNYQHFDIIARMKECIDEIDQECKRRRKEIRIRKLGNGYQYEHLQDNGTGVATEEITGFAAIRSVVGAIECWEEEKK